MIGLKGRESRAVVAWRVRTAGDFWRGCLCSRVGSAADDGVLPLPFDTVSCPLSMTLLFVQVVMPLRAVWVVSARGRLVSGLAADAAVAPLGSTTPSIQYVSPTHA